MSAIKMSDDEIATILGPTGEPAVVPTITLTQKEAELLRNYKKLLQRLRLREALYCNDCWDGSREDGCKAFVTDAQIGIQCRCKMRFFQGSTF